MESLNKEGRFLFAQCTVGWLIYLSQAYYHIQVDPKYWKYLCFRWKGKVYCFTVLPFGITSALCIFTPVLSVIIKHWRDQFNIRVLPFMDDLTGASRTAALGAVQGKLMIAHLRNLSWIIQLKKVVGVPSPLPIIEALGVLINFPAQLYQAAPKKVEEVKVLATSIASKKTVMERDLTRLAGCIMCIMIAVGSACCIRTQSMYRDIQSRLKPGDSHRDKSTFK